MVSIIIPVYNHERYINATLNSVLLDDTSDVELIVCDDKSKDSSFSLVTSWLNQNSKRFKKTLAYQNTENIGIVRTLNDLLSKVTGDFIFPIASDDLFCPGYIAKRIESLARYDIVINRSSVIDTNGSILSSNAAWNLFKIPSCNYKKEWLLPYIIVLQWSVVGPATCYRKSLFDRIGGYNENYTVEDREFFLRAVLNNVKIGYINDLLTQYRVHTSNASRSAHGNIRVRREVSRINTDCAPLFDNVLFRIYLLSYRFDEKCLANNLVQTYRIFKIVRYALVYSCVLPLSYFFMLLKNAKGR